ncbi:SAM-dependent methyltransferase [Cerasicoccus arenae]|uniref:SAM-dependent methyltransferase n=2 Tax=Cerasicoccus arenae TaxID=424488 RepID=A0A8J3GC26_9BACT|nr:hypothetical protein GCM10007047_08690 [Cerasicoccus arenae]
MALRAAADSEDCVSYADFSRIALYHETEGYYRRSRPRVGKGTATDFYTSVSVGSVFGRLISEAARQLITSSDPADYTLTEIGAEPEGGMFNGVATGFGTVKTFPLGSDFVPDDCTVIAANEVLDAQPFHRLEFHEGSWREWGVLVTDDELTEVPLSALSQPVQNQLAAELPHRMPEGYRLDISLEAESLLRSWCAGNWGGGVILIDYGKPWLELLTATPQGSARAYYRHQQESDLLARPGQQDLTTHVCWDRLEGVLRDAGFKVQPLERQEAFLVKRAWAEIERVNTDQANRQQLQSLLHPGGFGAKFQVLSATR